MKPKSKTEETLEVVSSIIERTRREERVKILAMMEDFATTASGIRVTTVVMLIGHLKDEWAKEDPL